MARPSYPSDDARRKSRPHVKIALDIAHHPRTAEAWADPEQRGMLVELLRIAAESWAGRRGGEVTLSRSDLRSIAGRTQDAHNLRAVRALCARVGYAVREQGALTVVTVENFLENQGFDSAPRVVAPQAPSASDSEIRTPNPTPKNQTPKTVAPDGAAAWLRVLSKEPGTEAAKRGFLASELPRIEAEAFAELSKDRANDKRALNALVLSKILGWYRQRIGRGPPGRGAGSPPVRPPPSTITPEMYEQKEEISF